MWSQNLCFEDSSVVKSSLGYKLYPFNAITYWSDDEVRIEEDRTWC